MKLPPFGKALAQRRSKPSNGVWIYVGKGAWDAGNLVQHNYLDRAPLVLPDDEDPGVYRWPVMGHDCIVVLTSEQPPERVRELGVDLILAGALRAVVVGVIDNIPPDFTLFKPKAKSA